MRDPDLFWPAFLICMSVFLWLWIEDMETERVLEAGTLDTLVVRAPLDCTDDVLIQAAAQRNPNIVCGGGR